MPPQKITLQKYEGLVGNFRTVKRCVFRSYWVLRGIRSLYPTKVTPEKDILSGGNFGGLNDERLRW